MGAVPPFCTQPRDFSSRVVMPPALLRERGFHSLAGGDPKVIFVVVDQSHRSVKYFLAGTAVHQQLLGSEHLRHLGEHRAAPMAASRSVTRPHRGLAVMPDRPSLPPHFSPIFSLLTGRAQRRSLAARACSSRMMVTPFSSSSVQSWQLRKRTRRESQSPKTF